MVLEHAQEESSVWALEGTEQFVFLNIWPLTKKVSFILINPIGDYVDIVVDGS
jgi:hypothetical protein